MPNHAIVKNNQPELVAVYEKKVTLNNTQIKALPTTPVDILPAPGTGKVIQLISGFIKSEVAVEYSNINVSSVMQFYLDAQQICVVSSTVNMFMNAAPFASPIGHNNANLSVALLSGYENKSLSIRIANEEDGNFLDGDDANTLDVTVIYAIVDL